MNLLEEARRIAQETLKEEIRSNGDPFMAHPDGVAAIVRDEIGLPEECQAAVYLHEATRLHPDLDISSFPEDVRTIVQGLNSISRIRPKDTRLEAENYKKLIVKYSSDPRVTVIKIADRLEIMRHLDIFPKSKRESKQLETLMLYIPLAHQLGLYNIKSEMEDIYFKFSSPEEYRAITNKLKATQRDRERLSREFIEPLRGKLDAAQIKYKLKVRTKTAYSIHKKMVAQKVPFEGVYDVFAMRFIVDCEPDRKVEQDLCWKVYSYVTEEYEPDTGRLRDWLTNPKPNGYESLHITVRNSLGNYIEVQIRSKRMDDIAENGLASHWSYKGIKGEHTLDRWLSSVRYNLEHPAEVKPEDMPRSPEGEIFVFTPTGELRILPEGSSVLDFAFNIHSGVGARCTGARIGGKAVSIREKLKTGDVVEVLTSKTQKPSQDWLNYVVSSKARSKIKQELDAELRKEAAQGREILERRLKNWKMEFTTEQQNDFCRIHKLGGVLHLYAGVSRDEFTPEQIKTFIQSYARTEPVQNGVPETRSGLSSSSEDILVLNAKDVKGLQYQMARCCNPVFGDDVFGFVTRSEGIKIHRISCPNAARLLERYPYRIQKVVWQETQSGGEFLSTLQVSAEKERNVMPSIMDVIGSFRVSLRSFNVSDRAGLDEMSIKLLVPSNSELDKVISLLGKVRGVVKVRRS